MSRVPRRVLFAASEATPWIKTGGLADVAASLPAALTAMGCEVRLLLPAYGDLLARVDARPVAGFAVPGLNARLFEVADAAAGVSLWLVDLPGFGDRAGNPYHDDHHRDWPDNARRFGGFARVAALLAGGRAGLAWAADVLHCNDWQTGLAPVYAMRARVPATTVFTIHNLQYRGLFPHASLAELGLEDWLWHHDALEFHGQLAFIKGGLAFADALTTVSPTYAEEIRQPALGQGLDGLLRRRAGQLFGVLNGIDTGQWNPAADPHLPAAYDVSDLAGKARCKAALQRELGLAEQPAAPLLGVISRLVEQKGIDLILEAVPELIARGCQLAVLGRGEPWLESALAALAREQPGAIAVRLAYDEGLAHRIEAGADLFLMPSRFEPCGLNQMYSQRYGTPPVVHGCGGLADSVVDTDAETLRAGRAAGFVFAPASRAALVAAIDRALSHMASPAWWRSIQRAGMQRDFSWRRSAERYLDIYAGAQPPG